MKAVASFGIVNADTSGPGAFLRAAKWYWDERICFRPQVFHLS